MIILQLIRMTQQKARYFQLRHFLGTPEVSFCCGAFDDVPATFKHAVIDRGRWKGAYSPSCTMLTAFRRMNVYSGGPGLIPRYPPCLAVSPRTAASYKHLTSYSHPDDAGHIQKSPNEAIFFIESRSDKGVGLRYGNRAEANSCYEHERCPSGAPGLVASHPISRPYHCNIEGAKSARRKKIAASRSNDYC